MHLCRWGSLSGLWLWMRQAACQVDTHSCCNVQCSSYSALKFWWHVVNNPLTALALGTVNIPQISFVLTPSLFCAWLCCAFNAGVVICMAPASLIMVCSHVHVTPYTCRVLHATAALTKPSDKPGPCWWPPSASLLLKDQWMEPGKTWSLQPQQVN